MSTGYDDMGPRIDLGDMGQESGDTGRQTTPPPLSRPTMQPAKPLAESGRSGGSGLGVLAMVLSVAALALALYGLWAAPEMPELPIASPDVVPGGTPERTAKLEKDVGALMLRLVTLEKELEAVKGRAGSVNKLTELSAKVAALQSRLDNLAVDNSVAQLRASTSKAASPAPVPAPKAAAQKPEPASQPAAQSQAPKQVERKKVVYTVRRGDTLFTVAQRYKVSMKDLMRWNDLKSRHVIKIGEKLIIYK